MKLLRKGRTKHKKSRSSGVLSQSSVKSVLASMGVIFSEAFSPAGTIETHKHSLISTKLSGITLQVIQGLQEASQALIP